ncbi:MAG: penicillin-binding protein 2 [Bacteroidales bacterium]|nr:penicillin-binding protein 2 [Bacteroidales bacterium]
MNKNFSDRKYLIIGIFIAVGVIFLIRLFSLQVFNTSYILSAENNVTRHIVQHPSRGLIFDRNNKIIVHNEAVYNLMVVPRQIQAFDTTELCELLSIEYSDIIKKLKKARRDSYLQREPVIFERQINKSTFAYLEEKLYKFPGFFVDAQALRKYPYSVAAHTLGYIGEVQSRTIEKDKYYRSGDYIGISGLEKTYEKDLRGKKGRKIVMVDKYNRQKGSYKDGRYDTAAIKGKDLYTTLDVELQAYGELLMNSKQGSIVAIEPSSGEILALITSPAYDPNLLVGRIRGKNYSKLYKDTLKPLFNRALMAQYPPGSTFKLLNALIGVQENVLNHWTKYSCDGPVSLPIKCSHNHVSPLGIEESIEQSCNPFHWMNYRKILENPKYSSTEQAYNAWRDHTLSMGFNQKFNTDLFSERTGFIPASTYYDRYYGKNRWRAMTVRSLSIGQGEILVTPVQLANLACIIANHGNYYSPHLVRSMEHNFIDTSLIRNNITSIEPENFDMVIEGMNRVFEGDHGTARFHQIDGISMCGKTGTVQNPHGDDHSIFIAFAPKEDPKIAITVIVENSGFGSAWAVPITSLMIEKYLNREVKREPLEKRMIEGNLLTTKKH